MFNYSELVIWVKKHYEMQKIGNIFSDWFICYQITIQNVWNIGLYKVLIESVKESRYFRKDTEKIYI